MAMGNLPFGCGFPLFVISCLAGLSLPSALLVPFKFIRSSFLLIPSTSPSRPPFSEEVMLGCRRWLSPFKRVLMSKSSVEVCVDWLEPSSSKLSIEV